MPRAAKIWELLPHDRLAIERLARAVPASPVVAQLLLNRGVSDPEAARRFLEAPLKGLHPPQLLPGVAEAAERLFQAVRDGRRVCVYGDYDADGTTGTAILLLALQRVRKCLGLSDPPAGNGVPVGRRTDPFYYVPHRLEEGYGLNGEALARVVGNGASLVVTVDCGIASLEEAEEARRLGVELIVTDHHEFKSRLPDAACLVHPRLPGTSYPFPHLSGAGVAFKLAWALCQRACGAEKVTQPYLDYLLDACVLAALGTVADVVPLQDENRIFVRYGLARLPQTGLAGLRALLAVGGLADKADVKAVDVGFKLAPRINAVGRLGWAHTVVDLLTTPSESRATELARVLDGQNVKRQQLERRMVTQAKQLAAACDLEAAPALVLAHQDEDGWHPGVLGIVAGRLAEQYARPVLLIALHRQRQRVPALEAAEPSPLVGHGSGRSVPGFALHEALAACDGHLLSHGGHRAAAGFKILPEHIEAFRQRFCEYAARHFPAGPPAPRLVLDAEVPLAALTLGLLRDLDRLEPYGHDNPQPLFLAGGLQVAGEPKRCGEGESHLRFQVRQGEAALWCIAFGMGDRLDELMSEGGQCCLAFRPSLNEWQGRRSVQLQVVDFQPGAQARLG